MKVLLVANGLRSGGKERQVLELVKGLTVRDDIEAVLVIMNENIFYEEIYKTNVQIEILKRENKSALTVFRNLIRICKKHKPDIIHTWDYLSSLYATPAAKILGIKLLNGSIRFAYYKFKRFDKSWFITKLVFPFANKIVANSRSGLEALNFEKKGVCIYNGFDQKRVTNLVPSSQIHDKYKLNGETIVGMVAKFKPDKDYESLVEAAKIVLKEQPNVTFVLIGDGPKYEKIREMSEGIPQIRLLGQQQNVESIINIFDICVLSTYTEGISNSIMEYMALGKPVIATDGGGTKELVIDNETGFLVNQESPAEIASKISYLISDPDLAKDMGEKGKERIRTSFSLDKMTNSFYELYHELYNS